jgi:hypothetical protein
MLVFWIGGPGICSEQEKSRFINLFVYNWLSIFPGNSGRKLR